MPLADTGHLPWVRLVLAVSLDGRLAPPAGGPAQLGGKGDRRVLEESLAWADACLIGAGTLRAHQCTCLIRRKQLLQQRSAAGRSLQPAAVVVSSRHAFPMEWRFFRQPLQRWLLSPTAPSDGFDRWFPLESTWAQRLKALAEAGVERLVLLGGASLTADLLAQDAVDELQLTLVPQLLGGEHSWLPRTVAALPEALSSDGAWIREEIQPLDDNELMLRYRRQRP